MLSNLFVLYIYQPFLNILVFFYWLLGLITRGKPDMGIAVIMLTLLIRVLLLPISLSSHRSEKERRRIAKEIKQLEKEHAGDPIAQRKKSKKIFKSSGKVVFGEMLTLFIQVSLALMLWRIFAKGLPGQDLHLIYSFMPKVDLPFNLIFLGEYDLSHPHWVLNVIQSVLIFVLETLSIYTSPYPHTRSEGVRLQLVLPLISFLIFMGLPAGKKLFVITTLIFSIVLSLYRAVRRLVYDLELKMAKKDEGEEEVGEEKVVVDHA